MKFWKWLLVFVLILLLLALPIGFLLLGSSQPPLKKNSVLTIDLSSTVTESGGSPSLQDVLMGSSSHPLAAYRIADALHTAAEDEHIAGVFLHGGVSGSNATLLAVREALAAVREAHKPVIACYGSMDERSFWLASAADELWMEPLGIIQIDGLAIEIPYFGKLCEKYGVEMQVTRVGKYKSAVEPYMLDSMSAENREQLTGILVDAQNTAYDQIAASRKIERSALDTAAREEGLVRSEDALSRGWITRIGFLGDALADWKQRLKVDKDEELHQIDLVSYARRIDSRSAQSSGEGRGVRVIEAEGEIVDGSSSDGIGGDDLAQLDLFVQLELTFQPQRLDAAFSQRAQGDATRGSATGGCSRVGDAAGFQSTAGAHREARAFHALPGRIGRLGHAFAAHHGQVDLLAWIQRDQGIAVGDLNGGLGLVENSQQIRAQALQQHRAALQTQLRAADQLNGLLGGRRDVRAIDLLEEEHGLAAALGADDAHPCAEQHHAAALGEQHLGAAAGPGVDRGTRAQRLGFRVEAQRIAGEQSGRTHLHGIGMALNEHLLGPLGENASIARRQRRGLGLHRARPALRVAPRPAREARAGGQQRRRSGAERHDRRAQAHERASLTGIPGCAPK